MLSGRYAGDTVYLCKITLTDLVQDVSRDTQEVIAKTGWHLLKNRHEKSKMIAASIYLMVIILNTAMNVKWSAWLDCAACPNFIGIGNFNTERDALAQITVTAIK